MVAPAPLPAIRRALIGEILRQLRDARQAIVDLLGRATSVDAAQRLLRQRTQIERLLREFGDQATAAASAAAGQAWDSGHAQAQAELGQPGIAFRLNARSLLATRHMLTHRLADVSRQAIARIDTALMQSLLGVRPLSQAITEIQAILDGAPRRRAMTIAYTEIGRVYNAAHYETLLEQAKLIPGLKKAWLHSRKEHGRPGHIMASHQDPIAVAEPFEIVDVKTGEVEALRFPLDPQAGPGNTVNCGCMMKAVLPANPDELFAGPIAPVPPNTVIGGGVPQGAGGIVPPIQPPAQPPGGGGAAPEDPFRRALDGMLTALAARSDAFPGYTGGGRLARLWRDLGSYSRHVRRRIDDGSIADAEDLAGRVFATLAATRSVQVALAQSARFTTGQFATRVRDLQGGDWIVLVDGNGRIVTAYPFDPSRVGFEQWSAQHGHPVRHIELSPADRALLARLFAQP